MTYLAAALLGYLLGCSNLAWLLARRRGFDIRDKGSNNAGASNAAITMGLPLGVAVAVHDAAKACAAALLAGLLFPHHPCAAAVAGTAAVLGHIFPFYLRFRGGKGFAPFLGLTLAIDWRFFLAILLAATLITLITDYVVLGTITAVVTFPGHLFLLHPAAAAVVCVASLVILYKHLINIRRLLTGQEIGLRRMLSKRDRVS